MRILLVTSYYSPEPFRVADVATGLRKRGHDVHVLTGLPNYPSGRFFPGYGIRGPYREVIDGIHVIRVPIVPRGRGGAFKLVLNYASFAGAAALKALLLRRRRWDAVFVFQLSPVTTIFPAILLRSLFKVPVVTWVQDLWPESIVASGMGRSRTLYALARLISGSLYRRCDRLLGTSRAFEQPLAALGVAAEKFVYLPQWAEAFSSEAGRGTRLPPGRWQDGFPIVFAGNLGRAQSLETVLGAAECLRADEDVRWVFIGDGSRREWLQAEVTRRALSEKVFLLGRYPAHEMPAFFEKAGALLVTLRQDAAMALTIPAKLQSYLTAARPILGSIDGEAARVILESGAGLAAPAGDPGALAGLVSRMKSLSAADRVAMGERGRAYARQHFDREHCLDVLERCLQGATASCTSSGAAGLK